MVNERKPSKKGNLVITIYAVFLLLLYLYVFLEGPCLTCVGTLFFVGFQVPLMIAAFLFGSRERRDRCIFYILVIAFTCFMIRIIDNGCMIFERSTLFTHFFSLFFLVVLLAFVILSIKHWKYMRREPFETFSSEEYFRIGLDAIPWSNIRKMSVRKSELGNPYVVVYLKNDEPPRSFDIGYFGDKETFLNHLKEKAAKKGYEYVEEVMT